MKKILKVVGFGLMTLGILSAIYPFLSLFISLYEGFDLSRAFRHFFWEGVLPVVFIFALTFFPGRVYYALSKKDSVNKLQNWSAILSLISLSILTLFILVGIAVRDAEGLIWGILIFGIFMLIPYSIGLLLLIIDWIKGRRVHSGE
ncbi:hypothetical protein J4416_04250 [Candidatus Pacearchaeota archaeon]|nr:hypothetical protein [Candidatus Pacearchaeota archaeon]